MKDEPRQTSSETQFTYHSHSFQQIFSSTQSTDYEGKGLSPPKLLSPRPVFRTGNRGTEKMSDLPKATSE